MTAPAQLPLELDHRPALAREDFLVAPSNADAVGWVDRWPDWPAPALAFFGPPGSGKSHLCQVWRQASGAVQITLANLRADEPPAYLGEAAACVVEDISPHLSEEPEVARRLLHLYNMMLERGGFLLLSDRLAPARWDCPLADLRSRLAGMQAVAMEGPDDVLFEAVLVKLLYDRQFGFGPEVINFVTRRLERSFTAVRQFVELADRAALTAKRRQVTVPLARSVLQQIESVETENSLKGE